VCYIGNTELGNMLDKTKLRYLSHPLHDFLSITFDSRVLSSVLTLLIYSVQISHLPVHYLLQISLPKGLT
jgi:hypothetical protein